MVGLGTRVRENNYICLTSEIGNINEQTVELYGDLIRA